MNELRKQIVLAAYNAGEGHIASAFSILDILWVLFDKVLKPEDRFILSKGHGSLALYVVLAAKGIIPTTALDTFAKYDSSLGGHPDRNKIPRVEASTGSLGHGLPMAVGKSLALKIQKKPGHVYCLVGDGECNEGSIWEACLLAAQHKLSNLCVIVDQNHSSDRAVNMDRLTSKFKSFGFFSTSVSGHEQTDIKDALAYRTSVPTAIIAETVKGKGSYLMENNPEWHHKVPNKQELENILKELE